MKLTPGVSTLINMRQFFGLDDGTLHSVYEELGVLDNLQGEIQGDKWVAKNGNVFSYDPEKQVIDGKVQIVQTEGAEATIKGFPMTPEQRDLVAAKVASLPMGNLFVLHYTDLEESDPVLEKINFAEGTRQISSTYKVHFLTADGEIAFIDPSNISDSITSGELTPETIEDTHGVKQIFSTSSDLAWIDQDGGVWGLGKNEYGQLGPENMDTYDPVAAEIGVPADIVEISGSDYQLNFLDDQGRIWISGNDFDETPEDETENRTTPTQFHGFVGIKQVVTAGRITFFLDAKGDVWTFNSFGETEGSLTQPVKLDQFKDVQKLFVGFEKGAYLDSQGHVWFFEPKDPKPTLLEGFEGIKTIALGSTEEQSYDVIIDSQDRAWLIQPDLKPRLYEGLKKVKQVSSGYATVFIA